MKSLTYEDWLKNSTPRLMWVWDDKVGDKVKRKVIYFNENKNAHYPIIVLSENRAMSVGYKHCAEIEEPKTKRMTHKELARWLREKPTREYTDDRLVYSIHTYLKICANEEVDSYILIREDDGEWKEPLIEIEE